jgi:hypothetical protein
LARFIFGDVAQDIQIAIKEAIADGGDNDVTNAAMINAWNLRGWCVFHDDNSPQTRPGPMRGWSERSQLAASGARLWKAARRGNIPLLRRR